MDKGSNNFVKDIVGIHKILPYVDVRRDGAFRYTVSNPGSWVAHASNIVSTVKVSIGNRQLVLLKDRILLDGEEAELCLRSNQCLSAGGIKIRIGALVLAFYSWLDELPLPITRRKMLHYINGVEKDPELAEFAVWALAARNALFDEAIEIATALVEEIRRLRLAARV
jgi:hypothetical protein